MHVELIIVLKILVSVIILVFLKGLVEFAASSLFPEKWKTQKVARVAGRKVGLEALERTMRKVSMKCGMEICMRGYSKQVTILPPVRMRLSAQWVCVDTLEEMAMRIFNNQKQTGELEGDYIVEIHLDYFSSKPEKDEYIDSIDAVAMAILKDIPNVTLNELY